MTEKENFPQGQEEAPGQDDQSLNNQTPMNLEEQEQRNSNNLIQRIEEEDTASDDYGDLDETTDEPSRGEEDLSHFTERTLPADENRPPIGSDRPVSKNQLGDNPPGSEQKAFESENAGDMNEEQAKYQDKNIVENFRGNLDKTAAEIKSDKDLKQEE